MLKYLLIGMLTAVASTTFGDPATANSKDPVTVQPALTHQGKVVSVADMKLVTSDKDGKNEKSHAITATAKITLDGKGIKLEELKKGDTVTITVAEGVVTMVEATRTAARNP